MFRNRATQPLKDMIDFAAGSLAEKGSDNAAMFAAFATDVAGWIAQPPVYRNHLKPNKPLVEVAANGRVNFKEIPRGTTMEDASKPSVTIPSPRQWHACHTSHVACYTSHTSHVTRHTSHVTRRTSHVTPSRRTRSPPVSS
jgi:hypothetical protein